MLLKHLNILALKTCQKTGLFTEIWKESAIIKEGTELRPIRHWSKAAVIGYLLIVFLTNCLINLTLFLAKSPVVKNVKLLKKYLNYVDKYEDKSLELRW